MAKIQHRTKNSLSTNPGESIAIHAGIFAAFYQGPRKAYHHFLTQLVVYISVELRPFWLRFLAALIQRKFMRVSTIV